METSLLPGVLQPIPMGKSTYKYPLVLWHSVLYSLHKMIVKKKDGYYVLSEKMHATSSGLKRRNLGGPYKTREEAEKRLRQVEFFKHQKT